MNNPTFGTVSKPSVPPHMKIFSERVHCWLGSGPLATISDDGVRDYGHRNLMLVVDSEDEDVFAFVAFDDDLLSYKPDAIAEFAGSTVAILEAVRASLGLLPANYTDN